MTSSITQDEFRAFRDLLLKEAGISLSDSKSQLVASRLMRRLRHYGFKSYGEYYEYLMTADPQGIERVQMVNCLTTNKTDFFREAHHFDTLRDTVLARIQERARRGGPRRVRIWSAACSTGEEPYTIAITLKEAFGGLVGWDIQILATDIDTEVLAKAESGIYGRDRIEGLSEDLVRRHFLQGKGEQQHLVRIRPELQALVSFRRLNFLDADWKVEGRFDAIFCRNVLIYFERDLQAKIIDGLSHRLDPEGLLMIGHSESLHWMRTQLVPVRNTVYRLKQASEPTAALPAPPAPAAAVRPSAGPARPAAPKPIRRTVPAGRPIEYLATTVQAPGTHPHGELHVLKVPMGGLSAGDGASVMSTLVGSCVCACIFDPVAGVGGMSHFMLPAGATEQTTRYGEPALQELIRRIETLGGLRARFQAKAFGGGHVVDTLAPTVPDQNVAFVIGFLAREGIPLVARKLGGSDPLEIRFFPGSGRAQVRVVPRLEPVSAREAALIKGRIGRNG